jgi:hypothetical protein
MLVVCDVIPFNFSKLLGFLSLLNFRTKMESCCPLLPHAVCTSVSRETREMVFDAHDRAFALFKGTCGRGVCDNIKTAVETIFVGKGLLCNRRFLQVIPYPGSPGYEAAATV